MIEVKNDSIIYVLCPAYFKTGGPELLHQLVYTLNNNGLNAVITYFNYNGIDKNYTDKDFNKYITNFKLVEDVIDDEKNIIIIPEVKIELINKFKNIKKVIWWLSVDNYEYTYVYKKRKEMYGFLAAFKRSIKNIFMKTTNKVLSKADFHLCQSFYAIDFLKSKGIENPIYLSDYINDSYLEAKVDYSKKEDIVLYNPKKGYEFTKQIIDKSPQFNWVPIQNMTTDQVRDLLLKSKVYIDFGNHPGKDRFPRETAMCGCCVITGKRGAAKFEEDVPIFDEFKFDDVDENIPKIVNKIESCLNNYKEEVVKFNNYKVFISNEKSKFNDDVKKIFVVSN